MIEIVKDVGSLTAGGAVVVLVIWKMFDFLRKKQNGYSDFLRKDDHQRECDYKLSFISKRLDSIDCKVENLNIKFDNKIDDIMKMLVKMNGGTKND